MPIGTPFHERIDKHCTSKFYKDWAGYYCVKSFDTCHEKEYYAFRHAVGVIDVTALFKYEVYGPDAASFLSQIIAKNISKLKIGQVTYCCWCDDEGKVMDDGTVTRISENYYRVTAAAPSWHWFQQFTRGYDVTMEDTSAEMGALAIQGPNSRELIKQICDADMDSLGFFKHTRAKFDGFEADITRTGYTGDLGYEIWVKNKDATRLWDQVFDAGRSYGIEACGMDAMDVTRVEAGFIMNGVDYFSANHCMIEARKSTPYELGLGWTVNLKREPFVGQKALKAEKENGSLWQTVGLVYDWDEMERLYAKFGLPPQICSQAWRTSVPVYDQSGFQVGYATSGSWSPMLKKNLAIATIRTADATVGNKLKIEMTVEYERHQITATVSKTPFYNPERKRFTPNGPSRKKK